MANREPGTSKSTKQEVVSIARKLRSPIFYWREIVVVQFFTPKIREGKLHPSVPPCSTQTR